MGKEEKQNRAREVGCAGRTRVGGILSRMAGVDLTVKMTLQQRLERGEELAVSICGYRGKSVRGGGNSICKDPNRECLKNIQ